MSAKNKLKRFAENASFHNVIQPTFQEVIDDSIELKGKWREQFFKNSNPIVVELGCGKGEYTINLARKYPDRNFIGIDIKGARFWRGAKTAIEENLPNVAFIRTQIEFIDAFFALDELDEVWITFPDPQLKRKRAKKRLTAPYFLNKYKHIVKSSGLVHLKTDSSELHTYTIRLLEHNKQAFLLCTNDLYNSPVLNEELSIKTAYEKEYLKQGKAITYISFSLNNTINYIQLPDNLL
ncbi:MAG: tRNA (guanosine(46)-N7)-methyltransferase TrmB [Bacteroidales bacterium]|nr:tRNA (guanosine(46)-N7)-methyltransferase TrmB [Bacteroidales bacterium]